MSWWRGYDGDNKVVEWWPRTTCIIRITILHFRQLGLLTSFRYPPSLHPVCTRIRLFITVYLWASCHQRRGAMETTTKFSRDKIPPEVPATLQYLRHHRFLTWIQSPPSSVCAHQDLIWVFIIAWPGPLSAREVDAEKDLAVLGLLLSRATWELQTVIPRVCYLISVAFMLRSKVLTYLDLEVPPDVEIMLNKTPPLAIMLKKKVLYLNLILFHKILKGKYFQPFRN